MSVTLNRLFLFFLATIILSYFYLRPLNSEWFRIITADGLGYYSYLPAKFIHHDDNLDFKWFNETYPKYYAYNSFSVPVENFSADYNGKTINKYYPGLSFLWIPFFFFAHFLSHLFNFQPDGLSVLYQICIGFSAVLYTCLGLWFLRRLIFKLFNNALIATLVPIVIFYGTNLFSFTIYYGTFSHAYTFSFISMALYFAWCFFNESENKLNNFLLFSFCFLVVVFIRPFNILFLIALPFVFKKSFISGLNNLKINFKTIGVLIITALLLYYQFSILFKQTGTLFPNTYTGEKFYFNKPPHLFGVLFSYQCGWFLYVPLAFLSCLSVFFIKKNKRFVFLFLLLALIIYLYSSWWFWTVLTRTIVDYTWIVALLLALLLSNFLNKKRVFGVLIILVFLFTAYFQLKAYQFRNGILDQNYNYSYYYWKHFFTTDLVNIFSVPPKTIIESETHAEDFEKYDGMSYYSQEKAYQSKSSNIIDASHLYSKTFNYKIPAFFAKQGFKKIKTSAWFYFSDDISNLQLVFRFYKTKDVTLAEIPFYIGKERIRYNNWELKEFGCDVPPEIQVGDSIAVYFYNPEAKNKLFVDNIKTEFLLTDSSMEMVP